MRVLKTAIPSVPEWDGPGVGRGAEPAWTLASPADEDPLLRIKPERLNRAGFEVTAGRHLLDVEARVAETIGEVVAVDANVVALAEGLLAFFGRHRGWVLERRWRG